MTHHADEVIAAASTSENEVAVVAALACGACGAQQASFTAMPVSELGQ
jgi:uncharacterized protein YbcC (UPF0753/DUF2309 family)